MNYTPNDDSIEGKTNEELQQTVVISCLRVNKIKRFHDRNVIGL
jgi:hypothetical protein